MFRAAAVNPYDEAVATATDENLTSEDWGAIIDLCDRVNTDDKGPQNVVQSIIKRLTHRNANVQLYTLEVSNALSQNCGKPIHRELSSRAFTDALLRLANDRNTHPQVKPKILERMKGWTDMFSGDADLGIMKTAYMQLKQANPHLEPPSAPQKSRLTDLDRQREEEDLQKALELSLQDEERRKSVYIAPSQGKTTVDSEPSSSKAQPPAEASSSASRGTTAATVSRVRAIYDFVPSEEGELEFKKGDVIAVLESVYKDWWRGSLRGQTGIFPLNYVEKLTDPTPEEIKREAQMEAEVFAEIKNVEKLLTLLSTLPSTDDNDEISKLYQRTTAIRPKLIKLIEKYSQKKDDFTQLNEKFIKARRDYESLLDASMAQPPQPQHGYYAQGQRQPQGQPPSQYPPVGGAPSGYPGAPPQQAQAPVDPRYYAQQDPQVAAAVPASHQYRPDSASPAPHYQHPPQSSGTPAPFFMAGVEVPAAAPQQPPTTYPLRPAGTPAEQPPSAPPSAPQPQSFQPFAQPTNSTRPHSTYGAQELATSVYDSPITPPQGNPYGNSASGTPAPSAPSAPPPAVPGAAPVPFTQPQPPRTYQAATPAVAGVSSSQPPQGQTGAGGYKPYVPPGQQDAADYYRTGY